jgi:hypothetical protein
MCDDATVVVAAPVSVEHPENAAAEISAPMITDHRLTTMEAPLDLFTLPLGLVATIPDQQ